MGKADVQSQESGWMISLASSAKNQESKNQKLRVSNRQKIR